jgi:hypothetical protein
MADHDIKGGNRPPSQGRTWIVLFLMVAVVLAAGGIIAFRQLANRPVNHSDIREHFKYGSIGSENSNGIPYWIWKVLPEMFPEKLPGKGYASLGLITEPGKDTPIGFSERKVFIKLVGLNCAVCHSGTYRESPGSQPAIVLGMPANKFDLQSYLNFLSACAQDERFNPESVLGAIGKMGGKLGFVERLIYSQFAIPQTKKALLQQSKDLDFMSVAPKWGPGRVDTFNPYKALKFHFPMHRLPAWELIGAANLPAVWDQRDREGMHLHWDGNNTSVDERNKSAALGAGVTPTSIDLPRIQRVADWLWTLPAPKYPFPIDQQRAAQGQPIYEEKCASCHSFGQAWVGQITPIGQIGTDPARLNSYTYEFLCNQNTLFTGYPWRFKHFRKTNGYANRPLDGIWLRSPYLHNGSIPTLRDLLEKPDQRPKTFFRGYDVFDQQRVGFRSDVPEEGDHHFFPYDTAVPGNGNGGHLYGTELEPAEKDALVEYMKTL